MEIKNVMIAGSRTLGSQIAWQVFCKQRHYTIYFDL